MSVLLATVLVLAAVLLFRPPGGAPGRFRRAVGTTKSGHHGGGRFGQVPAGSGSGSSLSGGSLGGFSVGSVFVGGAHSTRRSGRQQAGLSLTLLVQQLAALLKGGRTPARLWDELWLVHAGRAEAGSGGISTGAALHVDRSGRPVRVSGPRAAGRHGASLSTGSLVMLGAVRAAAHRGSPVSAAIRDSVHPAFARNDGRESRIWCELAACFDIAEASGCPLADVLTRFAAQLEVEDDAEAARQTALAGPKATVALLTWLPLMGLGLGMALGVDPLSILVGTPLGVAAFAAGAALTVAGRVWSARLVRSAAGAGPA